MSDQTATLPPDQPESPPTGKRKIKTLKTCNVCGRGFIKLAHLIRHARTHGDERPFSCIKCDKAFARTDALQRHERAVHGSDETRGDMGVSPVASPEGEDAEQIANGRPSSKKRKTEASNPTAPVAGSETSSTSNSFADENSVFQADFSRLFGLNEQLLHQKEQNSHHPHLLAQGAQKTSNSHHGHMANGVVPSATIGVQDFAIPNTSTAQSSTAGAFSNTPGANANTIPIASFMAAFPQPYTNVATSLDASIDSWLMQEGGSHAAEDALEMVFSKDMLAATNFPQSGSGRWDNFAIDPLAAGASSGYGLAHAAPVNFSTPSNNNGGPDVGINKLYPFGLQFEDLWKSSPLPHGYSFDTGPTNGSPQASHLMSITNEHDHAILQEELFRMPGGSLGSQADSASGSGFSNASQNHGDDGANLPTLTTLSRHTSSAYSRGLASTTSSSPRRKVLHRSLTTDTWLNSMQTPQDGNPDLPKVDITSPEQVIGELNVDTSIDKYARRHGTKEEQAAIPSMKFLDSCLHLYFRDFHPTFPILHKPTFSRHQSPPLLLLSMCSIGCIFMGTQAAREKGLWIYERLHHVIVFSRDSRMATEEARVAMTLSGLLGQCFSFLYGEPKHMFTAESFHGCLCTFGRRAGLFKLIDQNYITYDMIADLDEEALEARWQEWARREMLRRVALGLTLHAADAATYSLLPRLVPVQLSATDHSSDALFEAEDASSWKWLLLCLSGGSPGNSLRTPPTTGFQVIPTADTLFPMSIMAQKIVNTLQLKELCRSEMAFVSSFTDTTLFYRDMLELASRLGISHDHARRPSERHPSGKTTNQPQILKVMWHYCCLARLARLDQIEEVAGREGVPQAQVVEQVKQWISTPEARLATLHCAHVLHQAADLKDLAFIVPRAIFQSTLVLLCFIAFNEPLSGTIEVFDVTEATDWEHFAEVVSECSKAGASAAPTAVPVAGSGFEYVWTAGQGLRKNGFEATAVAGGWINSLMAGRSRWTM